LIDADIVEHQEPLLAKKTLSGVTTKQTIIWAFFTGIVFSEKVLRVTLLTFIIFGANTAVFLALDTFRLVLRNKSPGWTVFYAVPFI
jgi:hypothetical protein